MNNEVSITALMSSFGRAFHAENEDHPLTQKDKIARLTRAGWTIPDNLTFVPADFTKDNVAERLIDGGVTHL